jgi:hypothetical protein
MLEFRQINYKKDITEVVELIKANLDPNFTVDFFRWKHLQNPFGESYGLLALLDGKIVGLRMFMFWNFYNGYHQEWIKGIRPVDTVVDKSARGKGLFKKLTLQGLEDCNDKYDIIFNTPNDNSLPGYIKMGWEKCDSTRNFELGIINILGNRITIESPEIDYTPSFNDNFDQWITDKSNRFLKWRYQDSQYKIAKAQSNYIIYSISKFSILNQIIIHEIYGNAEGLDLLLQSLGAKLNTPLVYHYKNSDTSHLSFVKSIFRKKSVVVLKNDKSNIGSSLNFSLGDLEGKL